MLHLTLWLSLAVVIRDSENYVVLPIARGAAFGNRHLNLPKLTF